MRKDKSVGFKGEDWVGIISLSPNIYELLVNEEDKVSFLLFCGLEYKHSWMGTFIEKGGGPS